MPGELAGLSTARRTFGHFARLHTSSLPGKARREQKRARRRGPVRAPAFPPAPAGSLETDAWGGSHGRRARKGQVPVPGKRQLGALPTRVWMSLDASFRAPFFAGEVQKSPLPPGRRPPAAEESGVGVGSPGRRGSGVVSQRLRDLFFQTEFLTQVTSQLAPCAAWAESEAPTSRRGPERWHRQRLRAHPSS